MSKYGAKGPEVQKLQAGLLRLGYDHVRVSGDYDVRTDALLAHETQVDPTSKFWFGLPSDIARHVHPWDDYILARTLVDSPIPEDDLFAGVREHVERHASAGSGR